MIGFNDAMLEDILMAATDELCSARGEGLTLLPADTLPLFTDSDKTLGLLSFARATGKPTRQSVFTYLARRKAITVEETDWQKLPEAVKGYFDVLARLIGAFAFEAALDNGEPALRIVQAKPPRVRDTIFERTGGKDRGFEKYGEDYPQSMPTSTGQVHIERASFGPPAEKNPDQQRIDEGVAAAAAHGIAPMRAKPLEATLGGLAAEDGGEALGALAAEIFERTGPAPAPVAPLAPMAVDMFKDGERVKGTVMISTPFRKPPGAGIAKE